MRKFSILLSTFIAAIALAKPGDKHTIGQEQAGYRKSPSPLAKRIGVFKYGEEVVEEKQSRSWFLVNKGKKRGWLHPSSFAERKNVLADIKAGKKIAKENYSEEAVTAGKGFSPEFEKMYREKNGKLRFDRVDAIEKRKVSESDLRKFMKAGNLKSRLIGGK